MLWHYGADVPADNEARADLTRMLEAAKRAFMDAVDDERITADELSDKIQIGKELIEDLREIEASLRQEAEYNPNLKESLNYQIDFAAELRKILERRSRTFRNIAKGL